MPALWTPPAERAMRALDKTRILDVFRQDDDPLAESLRHARADAVGQIRRHERITWTEKAEIAAMLGLEFSEKQEEILQDEHQIRVTRAGRRSGKTFLAAFEAVAVMLKKPGAFLWVVAPDLRLTYRCWEMIVRFLDKLVAQGAIAYKRKSDSQTRMIIELSNGSRIEGESAQEGKNLQGVGLDAVILDEIAQIEEIVFTKFILPALLQRNGWAFLIGTPAEESWATRKVMEMEVEAAHEGIPCEWVEFVYESWHNKFEFPGGRFDPKILKMERMMREDEFLVEVCALPQASPYLTYGEFDKDVHARNAVKFNKDLPVSLSVDPSSGVNPYGILAIQDYGEYIWIIDEFYKTHMIAEQVIAELTQRPWWANVRNTIIDDAWPHEVKVWRRNKSVHFGVYPAKKSKTIEESIPLVRQWLREPSVWNELVLPLRDEYTEQLFPGRTFEELDHYERSQVRKRISAKSESEREWKFRAAKLFCSKTECPNFIMEMRLLAHRAPHNGTNPSEAPVEFQDHLADPLRYFLNRYKKRGSHASPALPIQVYDVPW